ncbi:MAG: MopE-related protein [Myxococcota bacterium]
MRGRRSGDDTAYTAVVNGHGLLFGLVGGIAGVAGCAPDAVAVGAPWLRVPAAAGLDDAAYGLPNAIPIPVANSGTAPASVTTAADAPFSAGSGPLVIPAGATVDLVIVITPRSFDPLAGAVEIRSGARVHRVSLAVTVDADADDDGFAGLDAGGADCDDADPTVFPGAPEACDGVDDDCDGGVDEVDDENLWRPDADGDGFGDASAAPVAACDAPSGWVVDGTDCDDADPAVRPDATETWYDGVDQDCDGNDDDQDGDGHPIGDDCNDGAASIHPGAQETWYDGVDQDCDGNDDDQDGDGYPGDGGTDCVDTDAGIHPLAPELPDGVDQDCDLRIDEGLWARGTLVISEVLTNPVRTSDPLGRFVELTNPTAGDVELGDVVVTVGVLDTSFAGNPTVVPPGGSITVCTDTDPALNGGIACAAQIGWIGFVQELSITGAGVALDELSWVGWGPMPSGGSLELAADHLDPDDDDLEANWCPATDPFGVGDLGTPGFVGAACL